MNGKQKCKILKQIRQQIAEANDINLLVEECTHKGNCRGTCPRCEWEVRVLERELEKRRQSGKKVALAGISAGFLLASCSPIDTIHNLVSSVSHPLEGDVAVESTDSFAEGTAKMEEPAVEETETAVELGEPEPIEETVMEDPFPEEDETGAIDKAALFPDDETGENNTENETDEDSTIAGDIGPIEEYVLEGDVIYPETKEEDIP